jgi:rubrerythrin
MDDTGVTELEQVLTEAMQAETDGYHFYQMAARSTEDRQGKEVFEQLAEEERAHLTFLHRQRDALRATGRIDGALRLTLPPRPERSIFTPAITNRLQEAHFEMSALSLGIQLELQSEQTYRREADRTDDEAAREFLLVLAHWEAGHYELLLRQQEELKEDYWSQGGFSPW